MNVQDFTYNGVNLLKRNKKIGYIEKRGYRVVRLEGKRVPAHRVIWKIMYGSEPTGKIIHLDGNKDNNRLNNLKQVDQTYIANHSKLSYRNVSGYKGVTKKGNRWTARTWIKGVSHYIGSFKTIEEAASALKKYKEELSK